MCVCGVCVCVCVCVCGVWYVCVVCVVWYVHAFSLVRSFSSSGHELKNTGCSLAKHSMLYCSMYGLYTHF